ncbi:MAG: hypothetical protein JST79_10740 [Acidobacteria bacterium]|nr:hypothetical protein [Acidobacteriota bacterium]
MTYKERFEASEERAHYQNIATKILREMSDLRAQVDSSPTASKRWVWELIQNAKDVSIDGKIRIQIDVEIAGSKPLVTFKHNGQPFSAENIRFLIEQISSKDRKKDPTGRAKTTGKFGTGFLTTHLLSEIVSVHGVAKEEGLEPRQFELLLDRSGVDLDSITEAVKKAKSSVADLDDKPPYTQYVAGAFNTAFRYELLDETGKNVAIAGLADLDACIPFTLAFVSEIETVSLPTRRYRLRDRHPLGANGLVQMVTMEADTSDAKKQFPTRSLAVLTAGLTTIAIPVEKRGEKIAIIRPNSELPRLFCDFPLLGTEEFPFPVVINNPNFNPTDARDGIFLTHTTRPGPHIEENKSITKEALALYFSLLKCASDNGWDNLHFLAAVHPVPPSLNKWIDAAWWKTEVLAPARSALLHLNIVRTASGECRSILTPDGKKYIWFPSAAKKEIREKLWQCSSSWFPHCLPASTDVEAWRDLIWGECGELTTAQLAQFVESRGSMDALSKELSGKTVYQWLNDFYALLELDEGEYDSIINKRRIFPNQNGVFCKKSELYRDIGDIDPVLMDVLLLLGNDLRARLLAGEMVADFDDVEERGQTYVVREITSEVDQKASDRNITKRFRPAFDKLLIWIRENSGLASKLFPTLVKNKHLLYDDDQIIENIERAEQLNSLLAEYNVKNVEELRNILGNQSGSSQLLPVTQEILARMGITSVEEWEKALEDKDLALLFAHQSTPTTDMFVYVQSIIKQAKQRITDHLRTLPNYDLKEMDETAPTVLAGIRKDGRDLTVVVRPAYDGEVIVYYGSERDVLDYEESELWIDDGKMVRKVTLGHILKTTQIRRFPV